MLQRACIVLNLMNRVFFRLSLSFFAYVSGFWILKPAWNIMIYWNKCGKNGIVMKQCGCESTMQRSAVSWYPENDRLDNPRL